MSKLFDGAINVLKQEVEYCEGIMQDEGAKDFRVWQGIDAARNELVWAIQILEAHRS